MPYRYKINKTNDIVFICTTKVNNNDVCTISYPPDGKNGGMGRRFYL